MAENHQLSLKYYWRYLMHSGVRYGNQHRKLDRAFLVPDPWCLAAEREQQRFTKTNSIIEQNLGKPKRILEIGSAEGHQSIHLAGICDELVGTDVSRRALTRARRRCPSATFFATDILSDACDLQLECFDLVVACEILYYVDDVPSALKRMEKLGRNCLVTFCDREAEIMLRHMRSVPLIGNDLIQHDGTVWHAFWWGSRDLSPDTPAHSDSSFDR